MDVHYGIGVSSGIVIGQVFLLDDAQGRVPRRTVPADQAQTQLKRLDDAIQAATNKLVETMSSVESDLGSETAKIFGFHLGMLQDDNLLTPMRKLIEEENLTAESAASITLKGWADRLAAMPNPAFRSKVSDVNDLTGRLLSHLVGERSETLDDVDGSRIVIAPELTPSQTVGFDREKVVALATDLGGQTSHTSIVARAMGIPAVVGLGHLSETLNDGDLVIVDGDRGVVIVSPDDDTVDDYRAQQERQRVRNLSIADIAKLEAITPDGIEIKLMGNIEFPSEVNYVFQGGGEGVGLYRTEYLYLSRETEPTEDDHFQAYRKCVELLDGKPLTIRTVDLGADKYTQAFLEGNAERNPFLGLRSIRYCLKNLPMFKRQLRAVLRASALGKVRVMFPLVSTVGELRQAKYLLRDVMEDLHEEGQAFDEHIDIGIMIEVPSAALLASAFAREVDFFSIGTNDLVQYTLAVDRTNERVADLYTPAHPAVLKLIRDVSRASRKRHVDLSCCGESAGDPAFAMLLIGLGVRTLSVTPNALPGLKRLIRGVSASQCERIAKRAMSFDSESEVSIYLRDKLRKVLPDAFDEGRA